MKKPSSTLLNLAPLEEKLHSYLVDDQLEVRQGLLKLLSQPKFKRDLELTRPELRKQVLEWVKIIGKEGYGALGFDKKFGGSSNMAGFLAAFETLAFHDLSLLIKYGVQFGLFGGSIHNLGTEKHHKKYLNDAGHAKLLGCFAMSEIGHGSNVAGLRTQATYDAKTQEFIIHTPDRQAWKEWIGNAAEDARLATVFCQLKVDGEQQGVHAILVPIRNAKGDLLPGIRCEDDGLKEGLNGVDNGRLAFNKVRVPRENLLDRFASVTPEGKYQSSIENVNRRFFTMLGTLVGGRVSIAASANAAAKSAITIAVRYAEKRRQFGPPEKEENLLLDYPIHQRRLLPRLAKTYAMHFALKELTDNFVQATTTEDRRLIELQAAALKPGATWHGLDTIQACREACGGQGYLAENRFADLKADLDVFATFEGDNTVLYQLVAKERLKSFSQKLRKGGKKAIANLVKDQLLNRIENRNPLTNQTLSKFQSLRGMQKLLAQREAHQLYVCATKFRDLKKEKGTETAMLRLQPQLLQYANAYMEHIVFHSFVDGISGTKKSTNPELNNILQDLVRLHFYSTINQDRGWFVENQYLSARASKLLEEQIDKQCRKIRPHAQLLVNAFGIPDQLLMAPIATDPKRY